MLDRRLIQCSEDDNWLWKEFVNYRTGWSREGFIEKTDVVGVTIGATQPVCMDALQWIQLEENRGMVGCFREEEEEVVIKFEEMVEVARVELATIAFIDWEF